MDLSKVMAIAGKSGLFTIISQSRGGVIVQSLNDGKKMPVFATHRSSILEDISMFTHTEDVPIKQVFWKMYQIEEGKKASIDPKADGSELKNYFETILPDFDQERVYPGDIKKVITWYNQLLEHDMISEPKEEEPENEQEDAQEPTTDEKKEAEKKEESPKSIEEPAEKVKPAKKATTQKKNKEK